MFLKRGVLPMVAILTSLHSYGALNKTINGTASATMKKGITLSGNTIVGPSVMMPTLSSTQNVNINGDDTIFTSTGITVMTNPQASNITVSGEANSSVKISTTRTKLIHTTDSTKYIDWTFQLYSGSVLAGMDYTELSNNNLANISIDATGSANIVLRPFFRFMKFYLKDGTYTGTYTIDVTYV